MFKSQYQKGFSLLELLLVVTIVGIIASIAIPYLVKAVGTSENTNAYGTLKTMSSAQLGHFTTNGRFARLDELNAEVDNTFGQMNGTSLERGVFSFTMNPITPTNADLQAGFEIIATKGAHISDTPCVMSMDASGQITELFGTNCIDQN